MDNSIFAPNQAELDMLKAGMELKKLKPQKMEFSSRFVRLDLVNNQLIAVSKGLFGGETTCNYQNYTLNLIYYYLINSFAINNHNKLVKKRNL